MAIIQYLLCTFSRCRNKALHWVVVLMCLPLQAPCLSCLSFPQTFPSYTYTPVNRSPRIIRFCIRPRQNRTFNGAIIQYCQLHIHACNSFTLKLLVCLRPTLIWLLPMLLFTPMLLALILPTVMYLNYLTIWFFCERRVGSRATKHEITSWISSNKKNTSFIDFLLPTKLFMTIF